jgi:hypothetical protein
MSAQLTKKHFEFALQRKEFQIDFSRGNDSESEQKRVILKPKRNLDQSLRAPCLVKKANNKESELERLVRLKRKSVQKMNAVN